MLKFITGQDLWPTAAPAAASGKTLRKRTSSEDAQGGTKAKEEGGGFFGFGFGGKKATAKTYNAEAAEPAKAASPSEDFNATELARKQKYKREEVAPFFDGIILVVGALRKAWLENDPQAFRDLQTNEIVSKMRAIFEEVKKQANVDKREFNFVGYEWLEAALNGLDKNQVPPILMIAPGKSLEKHLDLFKELVADYFMMQKYQDKNDLIFQIIVPFTNHSGVKELNAAMRGAVGLGSDAARKASTAANTASSSEAYLSKPVAPVKPEAKKDVPPPIPKRYVAQSKPAQTAATKKDFTPTATSAAQAKDKEWEFQQKARQMQEARRKREEEAANKNKPGSSST